MYFVGIMAENLGMTGFELLPATPAPEHPQPQQRRTVINDIALPGFRFHPTEEELVDYYLRRMVQGKRNSVELIASLDLYQYDPWELPAMAFMGEKEWFFFCPRDKKYPNGARPNRVTTSGYWKATGTDRAVRCTADHRCIGLKKTLVFYTGRAPRGSKTDWIMNEYRMPNPLDGSNPLTSQGSSSMSAAGCSITMIQSGYEKFMSKNDVALCRIYRKSSSLSSVGMYLESAAREAVACSNSGHQHLISTVEDSLQASAQKLFSSCSQRQLLDFPAHILQRSITSAPTTAAISSSFTSHCHQELPTIANSLLSSHAVMARLLQETCRYDGRSSPSVISLESISRSAEEGPREAWRRRQQHSMIGMDASKIEDYMPSSLKTKINIDSSKEDGSLESEGTFIDYFQHFRNVRHPDSGPAGDLFKNTTAGKPAADMSNARMLTGSCTITTPNQSAAEDVHKLEVKGLMQSERTQMQNLHHYNNGNIGVHSRRLLPNIAEYWGQGEQSPVSFTKSDQETSSSARLEIDAFPN